MMEDILEVVFDCIPSDQPGVAIVMILIVLAIVITCAVIL